MDEPVVAGAGHCRSGPSAAAATARLEAADHMSGNGETEPRRLAIIEPHGPQPRSCRTDHRRWHSGERRCGRRCARRTTVAMRPCWPAMPASTGASSSAFAPPASTAGPICRVRPPRRENCRFFDSAARAEAASFRPCLKCRPEIAPQPRPRVERDGCIAHARLPGCGAARRPRADAGSKQIEALALRLGISERHLRRIFLAEHGVSPLQYLQTRRLLLAKQLLTDSRLPVAQVALASGFGSLRRFNAAFAERYRMAPARLRANGHGHERRCGCRRSRCGWRFASRSTRARLLGFIGQRAIPGVEASESGRGAPHAACRRPSHPSAQPRRLAADRVRDPRTAASPHVLAVAAAGTASPCWQRCGAGSISTPMPALIDEALRELPGAPGLRLPGGIDTFELAVRAVLGQQVSVAAARTIACRFVDAHGERDRRRPGQICSAAFPCRSASPRSASMRSPPSASSAAVPWRSTRWPHAGPSCSRCSIPAQRLERWSTSLCELPGIGPWTAHYIAMRALGWPDAFPPGDVAVHNALRALGAAGFRRCAAAVSRVAAPRCR